MSFKLNQVTEAISKVAGRAQSRGRLGIQLKRLMENDRNFESGPWSDKLKHAGYAFFSGVKPGKGAEVRFSEYEAFALHLGRILLEQGQPQSDAVMIMRCARKRLEAKHAEILRRNPQRSLRQKQIAKARRAGSLAVMDDNSAAFLFIDRRKPADGRPEARLIEIVDHPIAFLRAQGPGFSATIIELVKAAHDLHHALNLTVPSKRGRGSS